MCVPTPNSSIEFGLTAVGKDHGEKLHDIPDEYLADALPIAKKLAIATGATDYNILQVCSLFIQFDWYNLWSL